jgi:phage baseplate assembly protein gpV
MKTSRHQIAVCSVLTLFLASCAQLQVAINYKTSTESLSADVGSAKRLKVKSSAGSVEMIADSEGKIEVSATKKAPTEEALGEITISLTADGDDISLTWTGGKSSSNKSVDFKIRLPKEMIREVDLGAGSISSEGSTGEAKMVTGAGSVSVNGGTGTIHAKSGAGEVKVKDVSGTVTAETSAGSVHVSGTLTGSNSVITRAGSVDVEVPASSKLKVKLSTSAGSVSNDFGFTASGIGGQSASGTIGDGSDGSLTIQSSAGSVSLKKK